VNGTFAEYAIGNADYVGRLPDKVDFASMAPILCAGVTTYKGIKETEAKPGDWLAISGIGGLGHVAVQYAKAMGLHVVALDVSEDKLALARSLGADLAIDARSPETAAKVIKETGGGAHGVLVTGRLSPGIQPGTQAGAAQRHHQPDRLAAGGIRDSDLRRGAEAHHDPRLHRRHAQGPGRGDCIRG
jgi:propanol-preferring alcohol dehydrogenase